MAKCHNQLSGTLKQISCVKCHRSFFPAQRGSVPDGSQWSLWAGGRAALWSWRTRPWAGRSLTVTIFCGMEGSLWICIDRFFGQWHSAGQTAITFEAYMTANNLIPLMLLYFLIRKTSKHFDTKTPSLITSGNYRYFVQKNSQNRKTKFCGSGLNS